MEISEAGFVLCSTKILIFQPNPMTEIKSSLMRPLRSTPVAAQWFGWAMICLFTVGSLLGCRESQGPAPGEQGNIAIYSGAGVFPLSVTALISCLRFYGFETDTLGLTGLLGDGLDSFAVLVVPAGDPLEFSNELGPVGRSAIKQFVNAGGGYIGLGGGGAIASNDGVSPLYEGTSHWPINNIAPYPEIAITGIEVTFTNHPVTRTGQSHYWTMYRWGPEFFPASDANVDTLYLFETTGTPAAIAFEYGQGRVFLTGFQPEFEESDSRDSTDYGVNLGDPDSEWELLQRAADWCLWRL